MKTKANSLPKISIITPSFNQGKFIKETIDSVLNQNYPNLEYIVMDGGSTDETVKILKSYKNTKYKNILSWVSKKDKGQADAINNGIKKSTGEIIAYLNSDDVMMPNTLHTVANHFIENKNSKWLTGDYIIIDENGKTIQNPIRIYKSILRKFPYFGVLAIANFIIQPSTFWRRSLIKEIGFFDKSLTLCLDFDYWMRIIKKYPLSVLPDNFSKFRIHGSSKGVSQYEKQFYEEHRLVKEYTDNPILIFLHYLHIKIIIYSYKILK